MRRRRRRRTFPQYTLLLSVLLFFVMGIGYAYLYDSVDIESSTVIDAARWNVHFGSVFGESGVTPTVSPTITDGTTINFSVDLKEPGNYYSFMVKIINEGTFSAKLDSLILSPELVSSASRIFDYSVTYADDTAILIGDEIPAGKFETLKVVVRYFVQQDESVYPDFNQTFNFSLTMNYVQGHGNIVEHFTSTFYTVSSSPTLYMGQAVPQGLNYYYTAAEAVANRQDFPAHISYVLDGDNNVSEIYVGYYGLDDFLLRAGGATWDETNNSYAWDSPYYLDNATVLNTTFTSKGGSCTFSDNLLHEISLSDSQITICKIENGDNDVFGILSKQGFISLGVGSGVDNMTYVCGFNIDNGKAGCGDNGYTLD